MGIITSLEKRRSFYQLNKNIAIDQDELIAIINRVTELVPDAFNMKSARVYILLNDNHEKLWEGVQEAFHGAISQEKINSFKKGYGTLLFFIDTHVIKDKQKQFELYKDNFPTWSKQANGMLQLAIWCALKDQHIGASLQHYNPIIDDHVKELFSIPQHYQLVAQMPFGGVDAHPEPKEKEDITQRVKVCL